MSNFMDTKKSLPTLGIGLGYRQSLAQKTIESRAEIDFIEVISEHYILLNALKMDELEKAHEFPIIPHGVELSIGSVDTLDLEYLANLKRFLNRIDAPWWSDHLSFTGADHGHLNNLLPLPFTREAVDHVVHRVKAVQEYIERPLLLENITAYMRLPGAEMSEAQFISEIVETADCGVLLDVNNVYVNALNHNFDPFEFVDQLPLERVVQIHIAGHSREQNMIIDNHGAKVCEPVYKLLNHVLKKTDVRAILLERDQHFPRFEFILNEIRHIRAVAGLAAPELMLGNHAIKHLAA